MDSRARLPIRPACPHEPEHLTLVIDFCKKWWTRIATKEMAFIGIVTLAASLVASWLKQFPGFSLFGALIIALLIGMVAQFPIRKWYSSRSAEHKAGVKDAAGLISNKLLRLGIILLGFKLNLTVLFTQGIKCLPIAAVVVTLTIVVCYAIARKLGVDPQLAILVAGGTGICGAAAVMGLSGSIKVPPEKEDEKANNEVMAVAIIAIIFYVAAVIATKLFATEFPVLFGDLGRSAFTLFQVMTLEGWAMEVVRPVMAVTSSISLRPTWAPMCRRIFRVCFSTRQICLGKHRRRPPARPRRSHPSMTSARPPRSGTTSTRPEI